MKLFRKFRVDNLKKDKFFSYLFYAIGEIILVVIGILVAVYINSENEDKKLEKNLDNTFSIIKNDLKNDIEEAKILVSYEESKEDIYHRFFENKLTKEDYLENFNIRKLIFGYLEMSFNTRGFKLLNEFNQIDKSKDSLVIKTIELYTHRIDEVKADDELRDIEFKETFNFWKKQDWWPDYMKSLDRKNKFISDSFIDYALQNKDYKNRVVTWYFINSKAFLPEIKQFIKEADEIVKLIDTKPD